MKRRFTKLFIISLLFLSLTEAYSQVTIGSDTPPEKGALLQLKDGTSTTDPLVNAKAGLLMPRVSLSDIDNLYPMLPSGYNASQNDLHVGLAVYNINEIGFDFCKGIYIWSGTKWNRIPEACNKSEIAPQRLVFYASSLVPKQVQLETTREGVSAKWTDGGGITWQTFPNDLSRSFVNNFTFHPTAITVGSGERNSQAKVDVIADGKTTTYAIDIKHLDREMYFSPSSTINYPATAGTGKTLLVESEAVWSLSTDATSDPESILSFTDLIEHPATTTTNASQGNPYSFTHNITANPHYDKQRTAKLHVKSSNPDFLERDIEIVQQNQLPYLHLNDADQDIVLDYGTTLPENTPTTTVKVTTNAGWKSGYNSTYLNVLTSWTPGLGGTQVGSTVPTQAVNANIQIIPNLGYVGFGAAGTVYSETFPITTQNHGTAAAVTRNITVRRTIPIVFNPRADGTWTYPTWGSVMLPQSQNDIMVYAQSNTKWYARSNINSDGVQMDLRAVAAGGYTERSTPLTITANDSWSNRLVDIYAAYDGGGWNFVSQFWQYGWTLDFGQGNLGNGLPAEGAVGVYYTNTWTTTAAPNFRTLVTDAAVNGQPAGTWWFDSNFEYNVGNRYFNVPKSDSGYARTLYFWVEKTGYKWEYVGAYTQNGQPWDSTLDYWIHNQYITSTVRQNMGDFTDITTKCVNAYGAEWFPIYEYQITGDPNAGTWSTTPDLYTIINQMTTEQKTKYSYYPPAIAIHSTLAWAKQTSESYISTVNGGLIYRREKQDGLEPFKDQQIRVLCVRKK